MVVCCMACKPIAGNKTQVGKTDVAEFEKNPFAKPSEGLEETEAACPVCKLGKRKLGNKIRNSQYLLRAMPI